MEDLDDDFGDIYADFEVQPSSAVNRISDFARMYIESEEEKSIEHVNNTVKVNNNNSNLHLGLVYDDNKKTDSVRIESEEVCAAGGTRREGNNEDVASDDSEDDLKIVLNDEDCTGFGNVTMAGVVGSGRNHGVGFDDDGDNIVVKEGGELAGQNRKWVGDQLVERSEILASNGYGSESRSAGKCGYSSQYAQRKYKRPHRLALTNNMRPNKYAGAAVNQMGLHYGYGFSLPWYRTVIDVNIDTLGGKPWRTTGVDLSDFFNFGFTEETWKEYCISLEQLRQSSMQNNFLVNECSQMNECFVTGTSCQKLHDAVIDQTDQVQFGKSMSKAIHVEDGFGERQSSMDGLFAHARDTDVVIQIKVQDSSEDCSAPRNSCVKTSETKECHRNDNQDACISSSSWEDELEESIREEIKLDGSSNKKRCTPRKTICTPLSRDSGSCEEDQMPGYGDHQEQNQKVKSTEGNKLVLLGMEREEGFTSNRSGTKSHTVESEISLSERCHLSLSSSCFISDSEASQNSVHVNHEKSLDSLKMSSVHSGSETNKSTDSDEKIVNRTTGRVDKDSKSKGPVELQRKLYSSDSQINKYDENYDAASPILEANFQYNSHHGSLDHYRHDRLPGYFHERKPYTRENVKSCDYIDKIAVHNYAPPISPRHHHRKSHHKFRESVSPYIKEDWEECFFKYRHPVVREHRSPVEYDHRKMDQRYADISTTSKRWSKPFYERDICGKRKYDKSQPRKQLSYDDGYWFDDQENDFKFEDYLNSTSLSDWKKDCSHDKHDRKLPYARRELCRRSRHCESPPSNLDRHFGDLEYLCWRQRDPQILHNDHIRDSFTSYEVDQRYFKSKRNYVHDTSLNGEFWDYGKRLNSEEKRVTSQYCYTDVDGFRGDSNYSNDGYWLGSKRFSQQSELQHFHGEEIVLKGEDGWLDEETPFFYDRDLRHERLQETYGIIDDNMMHVDDIESQPHRLKMIRGSSDGFIDRSPQNRFNCKLLRTKQRCHGSVDLFLRRKKPFARSSRSRIMSCYGRHDNIYPRNVKKRAAVLNMEEFHEERETGYAISQKDNLSDNFPLRHEKEDFDIEEGQIVTEKSSYEVSASRQNVLNCHKLTNSTRKRMISQRTGSSDHSANVDSHGSQRILESLIKMEKRRERFKEPVTMKKEADRIPVPSVDVAVETGDIKQSRPVRKRRWCGS